MEAFEVTEPRACRLPQIGRLRYCCVTCAQAQTALRIGLRELSAVRIRLSTADRAPLAPGLNPRWSMDFVADRPVGRRTFPISMAADQFSREFSLLEPDFSLSGETNGLLRAGGERTWVAENHHRGQWREAPRQSEGHRGVVARAVVRNSSGPGSQWRTPISRVSTAG